MKSDSPVLGLNPIAFGLSLAIVWALGVFLMGMLAYFTDYGSGFVTGLGSLYLGYEANVIGSLMGALWAFVDLFVCGFLIAYIYNKISSCCCNKVCEVSED